MEAGFNGDTGRVVVFFYEVKQRRSRLVSGWVTAVLDFVEDPVSRYIGGSGGIEDSSLVCCIGSALELNLCQPLCEFSRRKIIVKLMTCFLLV